MFTFCFVLTLNYSDAGSGRGSAERVSDPAAKPKDKVCVYLLLFLVFVTV